MAAAYAANSPPLQGSSGKYQGDLRWNDSFPRVHFGATSMVVVCFANDEEIHAD
jgi:hypothetical protein